MKYGVWIKQPDGSMKAGFSPRKAQHEKLGIDKPREKPKPRTGLDKDVPNTSIKGK